MALGTYSELQTAIADWLARDDLTDRIPDFIRMAEAMFNRDIRHRSMIARSNATLTAGDAYLGLPVDYREARSLIVLSDPHQKVEPSNTLGFYEQVGNASGMPRIYLIIGDEMRLGPVPDSAYDVELIYYQEIPSLEIENTNWLLTNWPDIYVYGTLIHSAPFLHDDQRMQSWYAAYQNAFDSLEKDGERGDRPAGQRMRVVGGGVR